MKKLLEKSINKKYCVRLETSHPDGDEFDGIIVYKTKTLIFFYEIDSFEKDGLIVLPRKWITGIRDSKFEKTKNKIIKHNGELKKITKPKWLDKIKTINDVISYLHKKGQWPIIEIVFSNDSALYIGPLISISKKSFTIKCYDAAGNWEQQYTLALKEIFKVEIGSSYANHFNDYMKNI